MIRVHRTAEPAALRAGLTETAKWVSAVRADRAAFASGAKTVEFVDAIYRDPTVKGALVQAQRGKCAFCESSFDHVSYGDVEHFRPKGGFRQRRRGALRRPGYYWLAYAWENLLVACEVCNRSFKRNWFPLEHRSPRARGPNADLSRERPRLVNPATEDPAAHITFHDHLAVAHPGDVRGRASIRAYGLNRKTIRTRRRDFIDKLGTLLDAAEELPPASPKARKVRDLLRRVCDPSHEYSAMIRAYLVARGVTLD
ncbi:MAG: hypothetical protein R3A52_02595 [Polyangiales bacterium]